MTESAITLLFVVALDMLMDLWQLYLVVLGLCVRACVFMCLHVHLKTSWDQVTSSAFVSH